MLLGFDTVTYFLESNVELTIIYFSLLIHFYTCLFVLTVELDIN